MMRDYFNAVFHRIDNICVNEALYGWNYMSDDMHFTKVHLKKHLWFKYDSIAVIWVHISMEHLENWLSFTVYMKTSIKWPSANVSTKFYIKSLCVMKKNHHFKKKSFTIQSFWMFSIITHKFRYIHIDGKISSSQMLDHTMLIRMSDKFVQETVRVENTNELRSFIMENF